MDDSRGTTLSELVTDPSGGLAEAAGAALRHRRTWAWAACVLGAVGLVILEVFRPDLRLLASLHVSLPAPTVLLLFLGAMVCEFVDSTLGMGYGTILTPLLMLAGFTPLQIVPAVLASECLTGFAGGLMHHRDGNVDFLRNAQTRIVTVCLVLLTILGVWAAVAVASHIPKFWLSLFIALMVLVIGLFIVATADRQLRLRPAHLLGLGMIAAFNKGMSGGGYGPLVTSGQIVCGMSSKHAVAITALGEGITCLAGVFAYFWSGHGIDWSLAIPMCSGALVAVPMATLAVRLWPEARMRGAVGGITVILGIVALFNLLARL